MALEDSSQWDPADEPSRRPPWDRRERLDVRGLVDPHFIPRMGDAPVSESDADVAPIAPRAVRGTFACVEHERSGWRRFIGVVLPRTVSLGRLAGARAAEDLDAVGSLDRVFHERKAAARVRTVSNLIHGPAHRRVGDG